MHHASQNTITQNIIDIQKRITEAEIKYARKANSVRLLAVSKTHPAEEVLSALQAGQHDFGENYLQDALEKIIAIPKLTHQPEIKWHFIGPIQSNKSLAIAQHFDWVHSIDRLKIARRLSEQRVAEQAPLNICIQVNTSGESSKSGVMAEEAIVLAKEISQLPRLKLRGLMTIPANSDEVEQQRKPFRLLRQLKDEITSHNIELDTLSMGMSNDMEAAIAEGATIVRIGTAIFGPRLK